MKKPRKENLSSPLFIQKLKNGEEHARALIVERYDIYLKNAAHGKGFYGEDAEDLVQDTWLSFFESVGTFEGRSHILTYLFGIFINKMRATRRSLAKDKDIKSIGIGITSEVNEIKYSNMFPFGHSNRCQHKELLYKETFEDINKVINSLSQTKQNIFYDRFILEEDSESICSKNNIGQSNLGVTIHRMRKKIIKRLVAGQHLPEAYSA